MLNAAPIKTFTVTPLAVAGDAVTKMVATPHSRRSGFTVWNKATDGTELWVMLVALGGSAPAVPLLAAAHLRVKSDSIDTFFYGPDVDVYLVTNSAGATEIDVSVVEWSTH